MVNSIKCLLEDYFNNTDLMNMLLKNNEKAQRKADKAYESRQQFLISILGKVTYNKYANKGTFAPIPLSAIRLTYKDFYFLNNFNSRLKMLPEMNTDSTFKLLEILKKTYYRNELKFIDNGSTFAFLTNIVFKSLDDIIDFFINVKKAYKKVYKDEDVDWKAIIKKFRNYLK